jgi:hypothetical protein
MKIIYAVLMLWFISLGATTDLVAQKINCYSKGEFRSLHKVPQSDVAYDFEVVFCKSAVNRFATANDTDKVLLLTISKNVGEKKGVGKYEASYKIVSSTEDNEGKDSFYFIAELKKVTKSEVPVPDALNVNKLTMYLDYENESYSLLLQDKNGKYFFETAEVVEDEWWGW